MLLVAANTNTTLAHHPRPYCVSFYHQDHHEDALRSVEWYSETAAMIGKFVTRWGYGKMYEDLLKIGAQLERRVYDSKHHCETRFAQAERLVYKNYCMDLLLYLTSMKKKIAEHGTSNSKQGGTER